MEDLLLIVKELPAEWQSFIMMGLAVWGLITKMNKNKETTNNEVYTEVIKLLVDGVNEQKELVRVKEVVEELKEDGTKEFRKVRTKHNVKIDDLDGIDVADLDVAKIIHERVGNKEHIRKVIHEVEDGAETRKKVGGIIGIIGRVIGTVT